MKQGLGMFTSQGVTYEVFSFAPGDTRQCTFEGLSELMVSTYQSQSLSPLDWYPDPGGNIYIRSLATPRIVRKRSPDSPPTLRLKCKLNLNNIQIYICI